MRSKLLAAFVVLSLWPCGASGAEGQTTSHGLSVFGDLKYGPDFTHFDYVDVDAPTGGRLRLGGTNSFDTLNPFAFKGVPADGAELLFDTLMTRAIDEPDAVYGLVAKTVTVPDDRSWVAFELRPEARWHDGTPITPDDVLFTYRTLSKDGHPIYRLLYAEIERAEATGPNRVRFTFKPGANRDLALQIAGMPVLPKSFFQWREFGATMMTEPLGSGPYRVETIDPGRAITYRRDPDYWARDLPVNRGRYKFDELRWEYYRDRTIALTAFLAGEFDFQEEFRSASWATAYDTDAVRDGLVIKEAIPDERPAGIQGFFINLRRAKFQDRKVRRALNLAFDFDWTNRTLFYGIYRRINSMFENSVYAARGVPSRDELALLEPLADQIPPEALTREFRLPPTSGRGRLRANLRAARDLLRQAGWRVVDGRLVDRNGQPFEIEFLLSQPTFKRIVLPYARNLRRLGIATQVRITDSAIFVNRRNRFDFDMVMERLPQFATPGAEQLNYFSSELADVEGSRNVAGIKNPAVDALLERINSARDRNGLITAVRALDRVLMWNFYIIPHWYKGAFHIAYWDKFGRPRTKPTYGLGLIDTWWYDARKAGMIEAGKAPSRR